MAERKKIAGVDVLLKIKKGEKVLVLGGQSGATLNRSTNVIETTSKDAEGWAESVSGVRSWGIDCDGFLVENDEALEAVEEAWLNGDEIEAFIALPSGRQFEGQTLISDAPLEFPQDDAASFSLSLVGTGKLATTNGTQPEVTQ
ncbi:phage tail tube protein [Bacillus wiedmannii]|uniref:phage tail tube protein n=1 Tax=Bacillus wiedmannii TaxID=1890302 RepID=UPI000BEF1E17|nr:phage tail protein [Bacillus wiedmannii]PEJ48428.1 phage major tail protein [Bacillus wiedmannii]PEM10286.1 phage major tail protein [Bacillus wiedmannii]PHD09530.1 phage major tail protein [Bacillus wiedmannii]